MPLATAHRSIRARLAATAAASLLTTVMLGAGLATGASAQDDTSVALDIQAGLANISADAPTPAGFAAALSLTATPTTNLADGDVISLTITGPTGSFTIEQCAASACTTLTSAYLQDGVPQTGSVELKRFVYPFDVMDLIFGGATPSRGDCAQAGCVLRAKGAGGSIDVPLVFDPDAPLLPAPLINIASQLVYDGQTITIDGSGFQPNSTAAVGLCFGANPSGLPSFDVTVAARKCSLLELAATDANGSFSIDESINAQSRSYFDGIDFDCNVVTCWIGASTPEFQGGFTADLNFISEELAKSDPSVLERLTGITVGQRLDQVHMAETKQGE